MLRLTTVSIHLWQVDPIWQNIVAKALITCETVGKDGIGAEEAQVVAGQACIDSNSTYIDSNTNDSSISPSRAMSTEETMASLPDYEEEKGFEQGEKL